MPRRKQGHSKPSATGGYPKKKTDTVTELIENESLKSFTVSHDLVFKIKKTISSTFSNSTYHEKIEREHLDASKSLNDINMVSKYEVNNNLVESVKEQDENSNNKNVLANSCCSNFTASSNGKASKDDKDFWNNSSSNISVGKNSHIVAYNINCTNSLKKEVENSDHTSFKKLVVCNNSDSSSVKVITTNESISQTIGSTNDLDIPTSKNQDLEQQSASKKLTDNEKQNSDFSSSQMSGVSPSIFSNNKIGCKSDSQQMNYRVSTSITESKSNQAKDTADSVIRDEQNCYLPSSVYGSPASSVEKVLTGLQVADQKEDNDSVGKISFLQEILQKKSSESVSCEYFSKQPNCSQTTDESTSKSESMDASSMDCTLNNPVLDSKTKNKSESLPPIKLKLHIPENFCNDDSNSSVLSSESQKPSKIPKITSPQILEQHISKIISENAAIVETLDPKWSRRYFKQSSLNSSSATETDFKKFNFSLKSSRSEESLIKSSVNEVSKLQSALLGGSELNTLNIVPKVIVSPLKTSSSNDKVIQYNHLSAAVPTVNLYPKTVSEDDLKGSAIKGLLSFRKGRHSKDKPVYSDMNMHNLHPQNPEGSIIKDLLLKSKSKEGPKFTTDADDKLNSSLLDGSNIFYKTSPLKCLNCNSEFLEKYSLDLHLSFCKSATKHFFSLRDDAEKIAFQQPNAQKLMDFHVNTNSHFAEDPDHCDAAGIGPILKKQLLLPLSKSPPLKRRKVSDSVLNTCYLSEQSVGNVNHYVDNNKNVLSTTLGSVGLLPHRNRSHSVHLFGGEVQIVDGDKTKRIKIKTSIPGAFTPISSKFTDFVIRKPELSEELGTDKDANNLPSVVVTIAQPVHNSGGTVHLPNRRPSSMSPVVSIGSSLSDGIIKYTKAERISPVDNSKIDSSIILSKPFLQKDQPLLNLSNQSSVSLSGPDTKIFYATNTGLPVSVPAIEKFDGSKTGSLVDELFSTTGRVSLSPGNKPFHSPIFPTDKNHLNAISQESVESLVFINKEKEIQKKPVVPTVLFTPSSPTLPQNDTDIPPATTNNISEPTKKFLAPTRPTSLPLKKKPFTMVGSTLISPETPRPKKTCIQLYLNGHAYTYLGLKCSTRSTYCCIYRPQPMFVLQETNPKLSMYSNWQVVPAKEELSGFTPGQMISFYCSKQQNDLHSIIATSKIGEPLIFTHSSYWTYRSTDQSGNKSTVAEQKSNHIEENKSPLEIKQESVPVQIPNSSSGTLASDNKSSDIHRHSTEDSNRSLDTDNTVSDADVSVNNSDDEDDEDCQDDGTESLTDSSQPQPPKRVKIFEGGFKSNEDYTYVRGRGRGKYVCEECGIRCKKPSMLKKHIRTHTDLRPYKCKHCSFAFKTKGNLTKHMKSKAHHKKCTELGIIPVPTTTDDSQIDEEALAKQIEKKKTQFSDGEDADDDDDETDETDDECESDASSMIISNSNSRMLTNGHTKKSSQDKIPGENADENRGNESVSQQSESDKQEAARSLLHLSAIGEPSQWSTSTGDLTDIASPSETEIGSLITRHDQLLLSPQYVSQAVSPAALPSARSNPVTDQWLSTETLGHRPRSYSADIPLGGGKELLAKYRLAKGMSETNEKTAVDGSEFASKDQYTRRYSISVAREARKPRVIQSTDWHALGLPTTSTKWPEMESSDQPMDLSVSRDLGKYKSAYKGGTLLSVVTQEESVSDRHLQTSLESCLSEQYQLKSLPVLSPQVVDYDASVDSSSSETPLLSLTDDPTTFSTATSTSRSVYYMQDVSVAENAVGRKEGEISEDPPSPDIDYSACSPVSPTALDENSYYYSQENLVQGSSSNEDLQSSSRAHAEFIVPSSSSNMEEGKCVCRICNKIFAKSSHLRLHVNIHYFERPFRCDNCAVSFRTKGHLQKHKRSVSHYNKVNMNLTFGTPTVDNPRPFKCADCKIAFRIHGHLAKHLRSKMHIMKLECLGKLPFGMYAEMERSGVSLNEIDTTDCNNSLESLQVMAQKLYQRDPRRMRWQGPEQAVVDTECAMPAPSVTSALLEPILPITESIPTAFDPSCSAISLPLSSLTASKSDNSDVKHEPSEMDPLRIPSVYTDGDSAISLSRYVISQPITTASQETSSQRADASESDPPVSLNRSGTCHVCGRLFKSAKFLQVHLYSDHSNLITSVSEVPSSNSAVSSVTSPEMNCDLCGKMFPNQKMLQQHLLSHAQPRPFVCEICDAGFTSSSSLIAHQATHQAASSRSSVSETRLVQLK